MNKGVLWGLPKSFSWSQLQIIWKYQSIMDEIQSRIDLQMLIAPGVHIKTTIAWLRESNFDRFLQKVWANDPDCYGSTTVAISMI